MLCKKTFFSKKGAIFPLITPKHSPIAMFMGNAISIGMLIVILLIFCNGCQKTAPRDEIASTHTSLPVQIKTIQSDLVNFHKEKDPERLREALNRLTTIDDEIERSFYFEAAAVWISWFVAFDSTRDRTFDPKQLPLLQIEAPSEGAIRYPTGVNPEDIKSPLVRKQYEADVVKHRSKQEEFNYQYRFTQLSQRADEGVGLFLRKLPKASPELRLGIIRQINSSSLLKERQQQFLDILKN